MVAKRALVEGRGGEAGDPGFVWEAGRKSALAEKVLLVVLVVAALGVAIEWAIVYPTGIHRQEAELSFAAFAFVGLCFLVVRTGYADAGVVLAIVVMELAIAVAFVSGNTAGDPALLDFLAIPILVAGLLLSRPAAAAIALVTVVGLFSVDLALAYSGAKSLALQDDVEALVLLALVAAVAMVVSWLLDRDLRLLRRRGDELDQSRRALETAAAERRRMFNQVAHDLSNPLSPMRIQLRLLDPPGQETPKPVAAIRRSVEALQRQVEDLKDLSRIEGNSLRLQSAPVQLDEVVGDCVDDYRPTAESRHIQLLSEVQDGLPVQGDHGRLAQVLANLVGNAIKFSLDGGCVKVTACRDGPNAVVKVSDDGRGLDASDLARLFRPFAQVHEPGEVTERGSGLGLFIAKGIVESHGGTIEAQSQGRAHGSTFTIRIPLQAGPPIPVPASRPA